jgi:hypothetical protein
MHRAHILTVDTRKRRRRGEEEKEEKEEEWRVECWPSEVDDLSPPIGFPAKSQPNELITFGPRNAESNRFISLDRGIFVVSLAHANYLVHCSISMPGLTAQHLMKEYGGLCSLMLDLPCSATP